MITCDCDPSVRHRYYEVNKDAIYGLFLSDHCLDWGIPIGHPVCGATACPGRALHGFGSIAVWSLCPVFSSRLAGVKSRTASFSLHHDDLAFQRPSIRRCSPIEPNAGAAAAYMAEGNNSVFTKQDYAARRGWLGKLWLTHGGFCDHELMTLL